MVKKCKILVVDDDPGILDSMKDVLESEGYIAELCNDGYEAIEKAKSKEYSLAIVDIKMPGMGGIGVLKALNEIDPALPVIIFTGYATVETAMEAIRLGAYDYITKPFDWERLFNIVKKAIEKRDLLLNNKDLLEKLTDANKNLKSKVRQLYKLSEVGNTMNKMLDLDNLLGYILNVSAQILGAKKGSLLLFGESNYSLKVRVTKGLDHSTISDISYKKGEGFIGNLVQRGEKYFAPKDPQKPTLSKKDKMLIADAEDFLSFPLKTKGKVLGLLNLLDFKEVESVEDNIHIGSTLVAQATTALDNARLYRNMKKSYLSTMEVLISTMEAKSRFTRGHSERVAEYSRELCKDLNFSSAQIDQITQASRLHDIGKITISDFVLNKPTKLTEEEWKEIKRHPLRGIKTLEPLGFVNGISPMIRGHHERFDGGGYPDGLEGKNIPHGARIIGLLDAFDAMTSGRPYRGAYNIDVVKKEIHENKGTQFDPNFSKVLLNKTIPRIRSMMK